MTAASRLVLLSASGQLGGAERVLLDLATGLRRRGHWQPHVVTMAPGPLTEALAAAGVPSTVVPMPESLARIGESGQSPLGLVSEAARSVVGLRAYLSTMRVTLAALDPDVVHGNGIKPNLAAARCAPPRAAVIWHVHDYLGSRPSSARLLRYLARRASLAIAVSESVARDARGVLGSLSVRSVLNAVNVPRFADGAAADLDAMSGLPPAPREVVRIGLAGTFARWKGHDVFLEALGRLPHDGRWRAYVIGEPLYQTAGSQFSREQLQAIVDRLGLAGRVGFTGFVSDNASIHRALDIVAHTSTSPEPFGLVLAEALASGRALVTTAMGGSAEIVRDGETAIVTPAGDSEALALALARLVADPALRARLGDRGRRDAAARFSLEPFTAAVEACYADAVGVGSRLEARAAVQASET